MKRYSTETIVGIFMLIGLICVGYMTVKLGNLSIFGENSYAVFARFNSISGLRIGSPVEMLGVEIGRIESLNIDQKDQLAIVKMKIRKGIKIYGDAIASIKTSGLIGDRYVSIDAGGADKLLEPGGTITNTESAIDIESLIRKYAFGKVKD